MNAFFFGVTVVCISCVVVWLAGGVFAVAFVNDLTRIRKYERGNVIFRATFNAFTLPSVKRYRFNIYMHLSQCNKKKALLTLIDKRPSYTSCFATPIKQISSISLTKDKTNRFSSDIKEVKSQYLKHPVLQTSGERPDPLEGAEYTNGSQRANT